MSCLALAIDAGAQASGRRPLFRDFMGINGHTFQFRPKLYAPVCRLGRDYHGFDWDVGADTDFETAFPFARNRVNWEEVYGEWQSKGFEIDVSLMFGNTPPDSWKDMPRDAMRYGDDFGRFFGPTRGKGLVSSVEIGNEPGKYNDAQYRNLFENMARGLRKGDPALKILPCNINARESGDYHKNVECIKGLEELYDVLNIHTYAFAEKWPTWRRVNPESGESDFLKDVSDLIEWRDKNAPGKPVWVTEFGWDACSREPEGEGDAAKFRDVSDLDQARYLVRGFLTLAALGADRAYVFFFDDKDEPSLHACSGITRNFEPKPAYYALAHLYRTLGDYRFARSIGQDGKGVCVHEFVHGREPRRRILAGWSGTERGEKAEAVLELGEAKVMKAEKMQLEPGRAAEANVRVEGGRLKLECDGSPVYVWLE